jgi:hypothetical protein
LHLVKLGDIGLDNLRRRRAARQREFCRLLRLTFVDVADGDVGAFPAKPSTMPRPMFEPPPVTMTDFPFSSRSILIAPCALGATLVGMKL